MVSNPRPSPRQNHPYVYRSPKSIAFGKADEADCLHALPQNPAIFEGILTHIVKEGIANKYLRFNKEGAISTCKGKFLYKDKSPRYEGLGRNTLYKIDSYLQIFFNERYSLKEKCERAKALKLTPERFCIFFVICTCKRYDEYLNDNWRTKINNSRGRHFPRGGGTFTYLTNWLLLPQEDRILSQNTYYIGPHANLALLAMLKNDREWLIQFLKQHKYRITIIGQNPESPYIKFVQERFEEPLPDASLFYNIEKRCRELAKKYPDLFRCIFTHDIDDYDFDGITSLEEKALTLRIPHRWDTLSVEKLRAIQYEEVYSSEVSYGFRRLRKLHGALIDSSSWNMSQEETQRECCS